MMRAIDAWHRERVNKIMEDFEMTRDQPIRLVIIESPYAGDVERNVAYARAAMRDSILRGEAPLASHLLYTQPGILDDDDAVERATGIEAGLAWGRCADATILYTDLGISRGMQYGIVEAGKVRRPIEERRLGGPWQYVQPIAENA